jgi:dephospho-CoA kinase
MKTIGLTGGIGSGKSTVSAMLAAHGAVIVDADAITRDLQRPGQAVLASIVERFGDGIVTPDGELDRASLAEIVFSDADALKDLNAIVHPAVNAEILRRIADHAGTDSVVILDIPLLVESGRARAPHVLVVDVDPELAVERLVAHRGMAEADARARIARQASREERLAKADRVIDNSGDRAHLTDQVRAAWQWITTLPEDEPQTPV